jgi:hypothetical protein
MRPETGRVGAAVTALVAALVLGFAFCLPAAMDLAAAATVVQISTQS